MGHFSDETGIKQKQPTQLEPIEQEEPIVTVDDMAEILPRGLSKQGKQDLIDNLNRFHADPEFRAAYRDNLIGYTHVLREGKWKTQQYFDAVRYVSFKMMGLSNQESFSKAFPDRMARLRSEGVSAKDISSHVAMYNKNKLVNLIWEQSLIAPYVLNYDIYQEAIAVQAKLMVSADSEKVRTEAANSILNHLKMPEVSKVQLDIGVKETDGIKELRETMGALAQMHKAKIESGEMSAKEVAATRIIDSEAEVVDD